MPVPLTITVPLSPPAEASRQTLYEAVALSAAELGATTALPTVVVKSVGAADVGGHGPAGTSPDCAEDPPASTAATV